MDSNRATETRKIAATTAPKEENFVRGCRGVVISADAACFIEFDGVADSGSLLISANTNTGYLPVQFTKISVMATSTANVYILAVR